VKIIKDKTGHFGRGLWYEEGEIEGIAERHRQDCLRLANEPDSPALDVDKFVEIYLPRALNTEIILDPYMDLQSVEGPDVLGATHFDPDCLKIQIDRRVTEEAERSDQWGRYNATATHEAGHCILHPMIFQCDPNQQVLFRPNTLNKISCLKRTIEDRYSGEWWEYQANQMMANLLMPKKLFLAYFEMERNAYGVQSNGELVQDEHLFGAVVGYLARTFQVSKQAVKYRLGELNQIPHPEQEDMLKDNGFVSFGDILSGKG